MIDLVICGPDFSGTSTQIDDTIEYYKSKGLKVRDMRGTEMDVLFHAEILSELNKEYSSLKEFDDNNEWSNKTQLKIKLFDLYQAKRFGSMVHNNITEYINPNSADVWIGEEPPYRGAGLTCRIFEQNRSAFGSEIDGFAAALAHQAYRTEEFGRFRKPIREFADANGKKRLRFIRSRSEESACYQIYDKNILPNGIDLNTYLNLPGHKIAFANPPTHIFMVSGPVDWSVQDYIKFRAERSLDRKILDDHEKKVGYQLLVNNRYSSDWIDNLYHEACKLYESKPPKIYKFSVFDSKEEIKAKMYKILDEIELENN